MLILDTHIVIAVANRALRSDEAAVMDDDRHWAIASVVLWEIAKLHRRGRIAVGLDDPTLLEIIRQMDVLPTTMEIARQSQRLDFESDPADEIIAATSIVHRAPLVTRDTRITGSKIVPLAVK